MPVEEINSITNSKEFELRLERLRKEIGSIQEYCGEIEGALDRLGISHVPREESGGGAGKPEPDSYLGRFDDSLDSLAYVREELSNHASRCGYMI